MLATNTIKNTLASAYAAAGVFLSLHNTDPGSTGAGEATGGTPAYGRKATTWGSPSAGVITGSQVSINVAAGTYVAAGLNTAASGGTYLDKLSMASVTVNSDATILVTPSFTVV